MCRSADRPWKTAGYGLGVMMDIETELGRCFGHSGEGPGSVCAVYHFPDCNPPRTVAAFAAHETRAWSSAPCSRPRISLEHDLVRKPVPTFRDHAHLFVLSER